MLRMTPRPRGVSLLHNFPRGLEEDALFIYTSMKFLKFYWDYLSLGSSLK